MPFTGEPTQQQIIDRMTGDFEAELPGADARMRFTFERVMTKAMGKASFYAHRHIAWLSRQPFPDDADDEILDKLIFIHGLEDGQGGVGRKPARKSTGTVQVTGASPGTISAGDVLIRADGTRFVFDDNASFTSAANTTQSLAVTAEDTGEVGNTDASTVLEFEAAHTGILTETTVEALGLTNGGDRETTANAALRLVQKLRQPGAGGGPDDFITWALEAHVNATRAWELPGQLGAGTVQVLFANDNGNGTVVPDATLVGIVQDYIQKSETAPGGWQRITGKAPVTSTTTVSAVAEKVLDYGATVTLAAGVSTESAEAAIIAEVSAFIKRVAEPGITITLNQLLAAVMNAAGVTNASLSDPGVDVTHIVTEIPVAGTFTPVWS